ncbi:beta-lactamase [Mucilaginibacter gracilis]|uniref:Beta-lactamase n=1 Tax=Mucilaginibacter gracilis TaxID=423350 RepID=A0A495J019_9SPHI|nr:serine hydrolase domain-containing protein [Mucilaginibacter gracilis]RKR82113.1 beta-lactamase [Mucilaginibacter gracilis]
MKILKSLLVLLFLCSLLPEKSAAQAPDAKLAARIDEYFTALTRLKKFNGGIYVQANGHDVLKKAYNLSADPKSSLRVSNSSQFDIHSISKLMAYSILVKLQQQHQVKLTDTLSRYLPQFPNSRLITIDQLLHHRSGLPRELTSKPENILALSPDQIIAAISKEKLEFAPGTDTRYSNLGYEVIYYLIQKITGKPFAQCVKTYIFDPLQMKASGAHFVISHANLKQPALNHQLRDGVLTRVPNITQDEFSTARIYSTLGDMMVYLKSLHREPYLSALRDTLGVIQKNGGSDGIRAQIYTQTTKHYSFVLFANDDDIPFQQTITDLVNILEGKPYQVPAEINRKAVPVADNILQRYTGSYDFAEANHTRLEFRVENGLLQLYQDNKKEASLSAENERVFFDDPKSADGFEFIQQGDGWQISWTYQGSKFKGLKVTTP